MKFAVGQLVLCYRVNNSVNSKLVGAVGEIKESFTGPLAYLFRADYAVFFPAYPNGICPDCEQFHDPILYILAENELKAIEDPDKEKDVIRVEALPEEMTV
jgi:hypothetical protein